MGFKYNPYMNYPWINPEIYSDNYFFEVAYPNYQRDMLFGDYASPYINPNQGNDLASLNNLKLRMIKCNVLPSEENIIRYISTSQDVNLIYEKYYGKSSLNKEYESYLWSKFHFQQALSYPNKTENLLEESTHFYLNQTENTNFRFEKNQAYWKKRLNISKPIASVQISSDYFNHPKPTSIRSIGTRNLQKALISQGVDTSSLNLSNDDPFHPDRLAFIKKFSILTDDFISHKSSDISIPLATDIKDQVSNFQRGINDEQCLAFFTKNNMTFPEGSKERLGEEYLKKNLLGCKEGAGGNLLYFLGSLKSKIDKLKQNYNHSLQVLCNHIDPCTGESFEYSTNGADIVLNDKQFSSFSSKTKDSLKLLSLADNQSRNMQAAVQSGFEEEELTQEALSAIYSAAITDEPNSPLLEWDKSLKDKASNKLKGFGQGGFQLLNTAASFGHSYSLHTHVDALENILDDNQRIELNQKIADAVNSSAIKRDANFKEILKIEPDDPSFQSGVDLAHAVFDLAAIYGATRQVGKGVMGLGELASSMSKKTPKLLGSILEEFPVDTGNRILKFKVSELTESAPSHLTNLKIKSYDKNLLKIDYLNGPTELARREASQILHKSAGISLKPFVKKFMPEAQVRQLIEQTGIPTFPRPEGIPSNYRVAITDRGAGIKYVHPDHTHTSIRVMPGKPHSPLPYQQKPYVIQRINGKIFDKFNKPVPEKAPEAHIPIKEFNFGDNYGSN